MSEEGLGLTSGGVVVAAEEREPLATSDEPVAVDYAATTPTGPDGPEREADFPPAYHDGEEAPEPPTNDGPEEPDQPPPTNDGIEELDQLPPTNDGIEEPDQPPPTNDGPEEPQLPQTNDEPQEEADQLPPTYYEALTMTKVLGPRTPILPVGYSNMVLLQSSPSDPTEEGEGGEEMAEVVNFPSLMPPEPPSYYETSPMVEYTTQPDPSSDLLATVDFTELRESGIFYCCTGVGGLKMPGIMVTAWKIGMKRIRSIGDTGNWPRYIFLTVQSLMLLAGIIACISDYPSGPGSVKALLIISLSVALLINISERLLFWCLRRISYTRDHVLWNFRADIIRLFTTEFFIFVALMLAYGDYLYGPGYYYELHFKHNEIIVILLIGFLYFVTAVIMKIFMVIKFTRSLLRARVVNNSNAATSQKSILYWLCTTTCAESVLQILLAVLIALLFLSDLGFYGITIAFFASFIPMFTWWMCFWTISPWLRFFPLSMALDLPPTPHYPEVINVRVIAQLFQMMYRDSKTCRGFTLNVIRHLTSLLFVMTHLLFLITCSIAIVMLLVVSLTPEYPLIATFSALSVIFLLFLSCPSLMFGLLLVLLLPCSPCLCPVLCYLFKFYNPWSRLRRNNTFL